MKKIISLIMVVTLTMSICLQSIPFQANAAETDLRSLHSPMLESYRVNEDLIHPNDRVKIQFDVIDENIRENITLQSQYVQMNDDSCFTYNRSKEAYASDKIEYEQDKNGGKISFCLQNARYTTGHKLSMRYGFDYNGKQYENTITFDVEETMRKVDKTEGEIKGYELTGEDKERGYTEKSPDILRGADGQASYGEEIVGMDPMVLEAQRLLNARYTGKHGYTPIPEDGVPGTRVATAFVTGLQIELGIAEPTGIFGKATKAAFDAQIGSLNIGSQDRGDKPYVTMLQYAMYCKGYNPGGITGNFNDNTAYGIVMMKRDAGFNNTTDTQVNAMWFKAVLNSDAYILVNKGDAKIRQAQQYLNQNYYNYFGIRPCDGHYSRDTNEACIYAWQAEERLDTQTANGRFGPTTKARCPQFPFDGRYTSQTMRNFIRILQFEFLF